MQQAVTNSADARQALRCAFDAARRVVVLTGAGISTESGVPDFRSPGSPWRLNPPIDFNAFCTSPSARSEAWRRKFAIDDAHLDAGMGVRPNRGHLVLARLVASGKIACLMTQNIDGLHSASGVPTTRLVELHGNGTYAACLACERRYALQQIRKAFETTGVAPLCQCGGLVKSATVSFGQPMPPLAMARALEATLNCDLFVAMGSSLKVRPAASLPLAAKRNGSRLVIVNRDATALDEQADLLVRGELGAILDGLSEVSRQQA